MVGARFSKVRAEWPSVEQEAKHRGERSKHRAHYNGSLLNLLYFGSVKRKTKV